MVILHIGDEVDRGRDQEKTNCCLQVKPKQDEPRQVEIEYNGKLHFARI